MSRQGRRWGSWLAMATLLLQLVVAAGHFHPEDLGFLAGHRAETAIAGGAGGTGGSGGGQPGAPAHDDCALCFSLYVAGSAALPDIAPPVAPNAAMAAALLPLEELRLASAPYLLFRTRAPPIL
ncbi:MAG: DUF2946 family protein [Stellaceae bacterium]